MKTTIEDVLDLRRPGNMIEFNRVAVAFCGSARRTKNWALLKQSAMQLLGLGDRDAELYVSRAKSMIN